MWMCYVVIVVPIDRSIYFLKVWARSFAVRIPRPRTRASMPEIFLTRWRARITWVKWRRWRQLPPCRCANFGASHSTWRDLTINHIWRNSLGCHFVLFIYCCWCCCWDVESLRVTVSHSHSHNHSPSHSVIIWMIRARALSTLDLDVADFHIAYECKPIPIQPTIKENFVPAWCVPIVAAKVRSKVTAKDLGHHILHGGIWP